MKVIIELEFDKEPTNEEVQDQLNAIAQDGYVDWYVQEEKNNIWKENDNEWNERVRLRGKANFWWQQSWS